MNNKLRQFFTFIIALICMLCVQVSVGAIEIGDIGDIGKNLNLDAVLDLIGQMNSQNPGNVTITVTYKLGDVDLDDTVTTTDARLALRASANLDILTDVAVKTADVNDDGKVTSKDARSILRYSVGLTKGF